MKKTEASDPQTPIDPLDSNHFSSFPSYSSPGGIHSLLFSSSPIVATTSSSSSSLPGPSRKESYLLQDPRQSLGEEEEEEEGRTHHKSDNKFILSLLIGETESRPNTKEERKPVSLRPRSDSQESEPMSLNESAVINLLAFGSEGGDTGGDKIEERKSNQDDRPLEPATLIYHESARSIVFRDHLRRAYINKDKEQRMQSRMRSSSSIGTAKTSISSCPSPTPPVLPTPPSPSHSVKSMEQSKRFHGVSNRSRGGSQRLKMAASLDTSEHSVSSFETSINSNRSGVISAGKDGSIDDIKPQVIIANYTPQIEPLPILDLSPHHEFEPLLSSAPFIWDENDGAENAKKNLEVWNSMTIPEREVATLFQRQMCVVKTIKKEDWSEFLQKFKVDEGASGGRWLHPQDLKSATKEARQRGFMNLPNDNFPFHSFPTSTSLLPACGTKMRCYGSIKEYNLGVVFALPKGFKECMNEEDAARKSHTWCWPSGYAAKTEYNISPYGELINGRKEALVTFNSLRKNNHAYLYEKDYEIAGRLVQGGLNTIPYNEVFVRVGGLGRIGVDNEEEREMNGQEISERSFESGLGLPIALFVRTASYHDLIAMLRVRARMVSILGGKDLRGIPLLYLTPEKGLRILTENLQKKLLHIMSNELNPFQNPTLRRKTQIDDTSEKHMEQKLQELLNLDDDNIRAILTPAECAKLAGGFGATDDSVAHLLMDAMVQDFKEETSSGEIKHTRLQDLVNEGLAAAVRSGDYNTSRQLLILYTLVVSRGQQERERAKSMCSVDSTKQGECNVEEKDDSNPNLVASERLCSRKLSSASSSSSVMTNYQGKNGTPSTPSSSSECTLNDNKVPPTPPPPPLDTDRLRSATNSDGLLAVLGAAEVLKSMQNNNAKRRATEAAQVIEEWVEKSEKSVAYRLASWRDLTAAQGDLKINTEANSNFMAFVSNKAILNRKRFAEQLRDSVSSTNFETIDFLKSIHAMVSSMHSPCLRLELLQFILGLDNRYSVAHVARSVELAATCLNISAYEAMQARNEVVDEVSTNDSL